MSSLSQEEIKKREALGIKKPLVLEKILKIDERQKNGIPTPIIDIAYDFICDFHCKHCLRTKISHKNKKLVPETILDITNQADEIGICQLVLSGGEPLLFKDLEKITENLQPNKFHLKLSTNGFYLNEEKAKLLSNLGYDKISVSIDSYDPIKHNGNRGKESYDKAINALFISKKYSLNPVIATVVSHQNCQDGNLEKLAQFASENGFKLDVFLAKMLGEWEDKFEVLIDNDDYKYLQQLHKKFPCLFVDTFPSYGLKRGCGAVTSSLHITPYGDVFPCVYIQVSIGNIFEESLKDIIARGLRIKYFKNFTEVCLSGRNINFIKKMQNAKKMFGYPPRWDQVFRKEDFIDE